jgi:hypothetical protein
MPIRCQNRHNVSESRRKRIKRERGEKKRQNITFLQLHFELSLSVSFLFSLQEAKPPKEERQNTNIPRNPVKAAKAKKSMLPPCIAASHRQSMQELGVAQKAKLAI